MGADYRNVKLIVCLNENFILPVYERAFVETRGNPRKLAKRYKGALVLDEAGNISRIENIFPISGNLLTSLFGRQLLKIETCNANCDFAAYLTQLIESAVTGDGYCVWAQFYDGKAELKNALLTCKSLKDICKKLHIFGEKEISPVLV